MKLRYRPRHAVLALATLGMLVSAVPAANAAPIGADARAFAPAAPTGLKSTGTTGTSVAMVWKASSGAASYDVKQDGVVVVTGATIPSAMAVGLKPSTTYRFTVRAKDSGGASSPDSAAITVTTGNDPGGSGGKVSYAGVRSSSYGISPFPNSCGWTKAMTTASGYFAGSTPAAVWIVGNLSGNGVSLQFPRPNDGRSYPNISFASSDKHESFLNYFDSRGIKVWLQVESGFADMPTLIDLVMKRYKHHPSVVGFGVDVEWFNPRGADLNDPVTDALAQQWENKVKSHNSAYTLFLKHFDQSSMPPNYRGQIVFVDDSQFFDTTTGFLTEMKAWADRYYPNTVLYQTGYAPDKKWWGKEATPIPKTMGAKLASVTRQNFGVMWVDFTLRDVLPTTC